MQFGQGNFAVGAGDEVALVFNNASKLHQHNWVLVESGTKDDVASAGLTAGPDNDWVAPGDNLALAHTELIDPGTSG